MKKILALSFALLALTTNAWADGGTTTPKKQPHVPTNPCPTKFPNVDSSCQQVCQACYQAGYVVGEWNVGDGFWADCVAPIVSGKPAPKPPTNDGRQLPQFPQGLESVGATCKAKSGLFWRKQ